MDSNNQQYLSLLGILKLVLAPNVPFREGMMQDLPRRNLTETAALGIHDWRTAHTTAISAGEFGRNRTQQPVQTSFFGCFIQTWSLTGSLSAATVCLG